MEVNSSGDTLRGESEMLQGRCQEGGDSQRGHGRHGAKHPYRRPDRRSALSHTSFFPFPSACALPTLSCHTFSMPHSTRPTPSTP
eukprot:360386-Chlamydomonas_euryale.AAC.2